MTMNASGLVEGEIYFIQRKIIDYTVAQIPAKGLLAKPARKKYGPRPDHSREQRRVLFERLTEVIHPQANFYSDMHLDYPLVIKKYFPCAQHETHQRIVGFHNRILTK